MNKEKSTEVLNNLIEINNDRIEGYETASKETDEEDLKVIFAQFSKTSQKCKRELVAEVNRMSGKTVEGTKITGKFFRIWMDVKAALTGQDRKAILSSCEYGEDVAVKTYKDALRENISDITAEQQTMLNEHYALIKADHDTIKRMRDTVAQKY